MLESSRCDGTSLHDMLEGCHEPSSGQVVLWNEYATIVAVVKFRTALTGTTVKLACFFVFVVWQKFTK
jgi:hypothetical protein